MYRKSDLGTAKYLVRFDDLCPEMNWEIWDKIEALLDKYNVKPIIAVVPHNEDPKLKKQAPAPEFWNKVRDYQKKGWMLALHGYNHVYTNHSSGMLGVSASSEFAGVDLDIQREKIARGIRIFRENGCNVDAFIAPSHSFDRNTLRVLRENAVSVISDGHTNYPYKESGFLWIPCQLWDRFSEKKDGVYTVCIHHNTWKDDNIRQFEEDLKNYAEYISDPFSDFEAKEISVGGKIRTLFVASMFKLKRVVKKIIRYK